MLDQPLQLRRRPFGPLCRTSRPELEVSYPYERRRSAARNGASLDHHSVRWVVAPLVVLRVPHPPRVLRARRYQAQRARRRHAQLRHRLRREELAHRAAQHRAPVKPTAVRRDARALELHLDAAAAAGLDDLADRDGAAVAALATVVAVERRAVHGRPALRLVREAAREELEKVGRLAHAVGGVKAEHLGHLLRPAHEARLRPLHRRPHPRKVRAEDLARDERLRAVRRLAAEVSQQRVVQPRLPRGEQVARRRGGRRGERHQGALRRAAGLVH